MQRIIIHHKIVNCVHFSKQLIDVLHAVAHCASAFFATLSILASTIVLQGSPWINNDRVWESIFFSLSCELELVTSNSLSESLDILKSKS